MIIIGVPLYVCATASIPIALAMMMKGATIGAAIVFLMVGPATNTTSIATMIKILGKKSAIITLLSLIISSLFFGILLDNITLTQTFSPDIVSHHNHFGIINYAMTIFFIGIIINTLVSPYIITKPSLNTNHTQISVSGITCQHCVETIEKGIQSLGIVDVHVDLDSSIITIKDIDIDLKLVQEKIHSLGYKVN